MYLRRNSLPNNMLGFTLPLLVLAGIEGERTAQDCFRRSCSPIHFCEDSMYNFLSEQSNSCCIQHMVFLSDHCQNNTGTIAMWLLLPIPLARPAIWLCQRSQSQVWLPAKDAVPHPSQTHPQMLPVVEVARWSEFGACRSCAL